jgi:transposase-like protein
VPTNHRYQVMPDLSPKEYAALKADIAANGVKNPKHVDEDDNILDGHARQQICEELGIEAPKVVISGLTEAQKHEYALRMNLRRRHLTNAQRRELARRLRQEGLTMERIAEMLGIRQSTASRWVHEFIQMDELAQPAIVRGRDGKCYPSTKARRRAAQPNSAQGSGPIPSIETDAEAHWKGTLQNISETLERLQMQGGLSSLSKDWDPETRAWWQATIRRVQEILGEWDEAVRADLGEVPDRHGHDEVAVIPSPVLPPIADDAQTPENDERVIASSAENPVGDVVDGDQPHLQGDGAGKPPPKQGPPIQEEEKLSMQAPSAAASGLAQAGKRKGSPARPRTRRPKAEVLAASTMEELTGPVPGASATLTESSENTNIAEPVEPGLSDVVNKHGPDHDGAAPSSGAQEAYLDGSLLLVDRTSMEGAGAGDLTTATVPMPASAAPKPLCPQCHSSKTWHIYDFPADRYACLDCEHQFSASNPEAEPSTRSPMSSSDKVQVASA